MKKRFIIFTAICLILLFAITLSIEISPRFEKEQENNDTEQNSKIKSDCYFISNKSNTCTYLTSFDVQENTKSSEIKNSTLSADEDLIVQQEYEKSKTTTADKPSNESEKIINSDNIKKSENTKDQDAGSIVADNETSDTIIGEGLNSDTDTDHNTDVHTNTENQNTENGTAESTDNKNNESSETIEDENTEAKKNVFSILFEEISKYLDEILCGLTFIGSLILAFAYKKGLLPLLQNALSAITGAVGKIKDTNDERVIGTQEFSNLISERLETTEETLKNISQGLDSMSRTLDKQAEDATERERFKIVINAQIDMLYDIFMSSSLPQYQKDEVGKKITSMKEALDNNDKQ